MEWELACLTRLQVMHSSNVQEIQFKATEIKKFQGHIILNWNKRQWGLKNRDGKMWKNTQIFICHHHLSSSVCLFPFQSLLMQSVSLISALWVGVGALISVSLLCHQTCEISFRLPFRCAAAGYSLLNPCVVAL